jgi:hypothetical protein
LVQDVKKGRELRSMKATARATGHGDNNLQWYRCASGSDSYYASYKSHLLAIWQGARENVNILQRSQHGRLAR